MSNDIGMVKTGPGPAERTNPTAKAAKADPPQDSVREPAEARAREKDDVAKAQEIAEEVASGLNDLVHELHRELRFSVDQDSGETIIKVIDQETDEVVRQIPSEEVVQLRKRLQQASGVIFQDSA